MPLVNCILCPWASYILCLCQPCSAFELVIFTIEACGICFHDAPIGWTYAFHNMCELESFHESYSSGILPDKISTLQLFQKWEVNERLCIGEVGVDLELCVHAHGHDVDLLIEASFKINYSLGISSSYSWDLAFLQSWFRPCPPLNTISCASLSTCLL